MVRSIREHVNAYLHQKEDLAIANFIDSSGNNQAISEVISSVGLRGLAVWIPPTGFVAADLLISVVHPAYAGYLRDSAGALVRLESLTAGCWHVAAAETWLLGAVNSFRLVSVAVGLTTPITQSTILTIARLR